jgi:hypothetical protein
MLGRVVLALSSSWQQLPRVSQRSLAMVVIKGKRTHPTSILPSSCSGSVPAKSEDVDDVCRLARILHATCTVPVMARILSHLDQAFWVLR